MTNDELLAKENTLSRKVDELKKELVEKQVALCKYDGYEETSKRIKSLIQKFLSKNLTKSNLT